MAWRQLGLAVVVVWASGCGSSSGGSQGQIVPGDGGTNRGGSSTAGVGGGAGSSGEGGSFSGGSGGAAGVGGNPAVCPNVPPPSGSACPIPPAIPCTYPSGPSCGPGSAYTICQCTDTDTWNCVTAKDTPCPTMCSTTVVAGQKCSSEGDSCNDACSNTCKCSGGQWFCNGQCTTPTTCSAGAMCSPGTDCKEQTPDGCFNVCHCAKNGVYSCESDCPFDDCSAGALCQPDTACSSTDPQGCFVSCGCSPEGVYECKTECGGGGCPVEGASCGASCGSLGQSCNCFGKDGPVPCTCDLGPTDAPVWSCGVSPTDCQQGASCTPGEGCGGQDPNGCSVSCTCGKNGTYQCSTSCAATCPDMLPFCSQPCQSSSDVTCKCIAGKEGEVAPCFCEQGMWSCTTPNESCQPGAFCALGDTCQVPQDNGCVLSCSCSKGGLYQCNSECGTDPAACPATAPTPGTLCSDPGLSCPYGVFEECLCKDGVWGCSSE